MTAPRKNAARKPKLPQDHQAKAEAQGNDITVVYDDHAYIISRENADDVELFEEIEKDHVMAALRGFLGEAEWAFWKDSHRGTNGKVSIMDELTPFMDAIMSAIGGGSKESPN